MNDRFSWLTPKFRAWLYGVLITALPLLVSYGILAQEDVPLWIALGSAVLGLGLAAAKVNATPEVIETAAPVDHEVLADAVATRLTTTASAGVNPAAGEHAEASPEPAAVDSVRAPLFAATEEDLDTGDGAPDAGSAQAKVEMDYTSPAYAVAQGSHAA